MSDMDVDEVPGHESGGDARSVEREDVPMPDSGRGDAEAPPDATEGSRNPMQGWVRVRVRRGGSARAAAARALAEADDTQVGAIIELLQDLAAVGATPFPNPYTLALAPGPF